MILDSNLIIYAARPDYPGLKHFITARSPAVSAISIVEVLGFHNLSPADRQHFEAFFAAAEILPLSDPVLAQAVALRQDRRMSLGDALIAATALVFGRELLTHNLQDFTWVPALIASDPLANGDPV